MAALEAMIALRSLAGERVRIALVSPDPDFVVRPMLVAEPFGGGAPRRWSLRDVTRDFDAQLTQATVKAVDADQHRVICASGDTLGYDTLILAPGAHVQPAFEDAIVFGRPDAGPAMRELLAGLASGALRHVAFVAPTRAGWTLPLYELALMTAGFARDRGLDARLTLITPESQPLAVFGDRPSRLVAGLLAAEGVGFIGSTYAEMRHGAVSLGRGRSVHADRVVSLPLVRGPRIAGVPVEHEFGFIEVDRHGRVPGIDDVYAAGDATDFPIKQGGLACQQADAVAEHVAARYGAPVRPRPFRPVLRGKLLTADAPRFLDAQAPGGIASAHALWQPATKIAGHYLAPYLDADEAVEPITNGVSEIEVAAIEEQHP